MTGSLTLHPSPFTYMKNVSVELSIENLIRLIDVVKKSGAVGSDELISCLEQDFDAVDQQAVDYNKKGKIVYIPFFIDGFDIHDIDDYICLTSVDNIDCNKNKYSHWISKDAFEQIAKTDANLKITNRKQNTNGSTNF